MSLDSSGDPVDGVESGVSVSCEPRIGPTKRDKFGDFDIQTWLIGELIHSQPTSYLKEVSCLFAAFFLFFAKVAVFVLIGLGNLCPDAVTGNGMFESTSDSTCAQKDDGTDSAPAPSSETAEPPNGKVQGLAFFCLAIVGLQLASDFVKETDVSVPGKECLRIEASDRERCRGFRRLVVFSMQSIVIASRFCIPGLATTAVLQSLRRTGLTVHTDPTGDEEYGFFYTNPTDILLNSLAVMFVLELDDRMCHFFVSPNRRDMIIASLNNLMATDQVDTALWGKTYLRSEPPFEVYYYDLNVLNRLIATLCVIGLFLGYYLGGWLVEMHFVLLYNDSWGFETGTPPDVWAWTTSCPENFCDVYWGSTWMAVVIGFAIVIVISILFIAFLPLQGTNNDGRRFSELRVSEFFSTISGFSTGFFCNVFVIWLGFGSAYYGDRAKSVYGLEYLWLVGLPVSSVCAVSSMLCAVFTNEIFMCRLKSNENESGDEGMKIDPPVETKIDEEVSNEQGEGEPQ